MTEVILVSPRQHAARLRVVKTLAGMLAHSEADKVLTPARKDELTNVLGILQRSTALTDQDMLDYAKSGAERLVVCRSRSKGGFVFGIATYTDRETG